MHIMQTTRPEFIKFVHNQIVISHCSHKSAFFMK